MNAQEVVLTQVREFWASFSGPSLDFFSMGKLIRGTFRIIDFKKHPQFLEEVEAMTNELERYLNLMNLKEFLYNTQAIRYARAQIQLRRGITYATGLSRQLSDQERELIRGTCPEGDRQLVEQPDLNGNDFAADLCDDDDDSDES
jgi:hypothetical protein